MNNLDLTLNIDKETLEQTVKELGQLSNDDYQPFTEAERKAKKTERNRARPRKNQSAANMSDKNNNYDSEDPRKVRLDDSDSCGSVHPRKESCTLLTKTAISSHPALVIVKDAPSG